MKKIIEKEVEKHTPLYVISIASELIGTKDNTLRLYEKYGLIKPVRRKRNRLYSENDIHWLKCLKNFRNKKRISIKELKKLLEHAPCWKITDCPEKRRKSCSAFTERTQKCWETNRMKCYSESGKKCEDCIVYLSRMISKN
jgi:MerR family transcriptional regulator/heat shock protein HspR